MTATLDRALAVLALLVLPFLIHGRGIADGLIAIIAGLFVLRSALAGDWSWTRSAWVRIAGAWWGWILICSLDQGAGPIGQAAAVIRFPLFVATLEHVALREARVRRWLTGLVLAAAAWLAVNTWVQYATGRNLLGWPRSGDGELTGPYHHPRASGPLARLMFPAALALPGLAAGAGALLLGAATVVLIGQRIPAVLTGFGLAIVALMLPRLRPAAIAAFALGAALVAASPVIAPEAHYRLVQKFTAQLANFSTSHYGRILDRGLAIAAEHPLTGRGFDAFRRACPEPRYFSPGGDASICVTHAHNPYLQALTDGGIPGLILFTALAVAWMLRLWPGFGGRPLQVGLFAAAAMHLWPVQSAGGFHLLPLAGIFFLLLGWGLAERRHATDTI